MVLHMPYPYEDIRPAPYIYYYASATHTISQKQFICNIGVESYRIGDVEWTVYGIKIVRWVAGVQVYVTLFGNALKCIAKFLNDS